MPRMIAIAAALSFLVATPLLAIDDYEPGPDSHPHEGVPKGTIEKHHHKSRIFPNTERDYWVYVPAQYDGTRAACVMVFQDGEAYMNPKGSLRAPIVFDNLIHKKEMPLTIGIFINPGDPRATETQPSASAPSAGAAASGAQPTS